MQLRLYQQNEIIDPLFSFLCEHSGNPLVAAPTGVGKSAAINGFIKQSIEADPELRFIVCTHTREIIAQNAQSMISFWPDAPIGLYSSGLKQFSTNAQIIYAGVQSIYKKAAEFGRIDALICDEAHTISDKENTMWQVLFRGLQQANPNIRIIGFTATAYRMGMGTLVEGGLFDKTVVDLTTTDRINQFVSEGYLCPLISKKPSMEIDITNVKMRGGEFDEASLAEAADKDDLNAAVVNECVKHGVDRNFWLVYATSIQHGQHLKERFLAKGITCEIITGEMSSQERTRLIGDKGQGIEGEFQKGRFRCLVNVSVLTTGFDMPSLDMIALARATQSTGLYIQTLGRLTRPFPGKQNGLVLDFGSNITRLGAFNAPIMPRARKKGDAASGEAPVKACADCGLYVHTRIMVCPDCGYEFPAGSNLEGSASHARVMVDSAQNAIIEIMKPNSVHFAGQRCKNESYGMGVKVSYSDMLNSVSEFHWLEAPQEWLVKKFANFWLNAGGKRPVPTTADEALQRARGELRTPSAIHYQSNTKHKEITKKEYDQI